MTPEASQPEPVSIPDEFSGQELLDNSNCKTGVDSSDLVQATVEVPAVVGSVTVPLEHWQALQSFALQLLTNDDGEVESRFAFGDVLDLGEEFDLITPEGDLATWVTADRRAQQTESALEPNPSLEIQRLRKALESIASNTCCNGCREAALVARSALNSLLEKEG